MLTYTMKKTGRLLELSCTLSDRPAVNASGYLITSKGEAVLYLVSLSEEKLTPPRRLLHLALSTFAKKAGAHYIAAVRHGLPACPAKSSACLDAGYVPVKPTISLSKLEQLLAGQA